MKAVLHRPVAEQNHRSRQRFRISHRCAVLAWRLLKRKADHERPAKARATRPETREEEIMRAANSNVGRKDGCGCLRRMLEQAVRCGSCSCGGLPTKHAQRVRFDFFSSSMTESQSVSSCSVRLHSGHCQTICRRPSSTASRAQTVGAGSPTSPCRVAIPGRKRPSGSAASNGPVWPAALPGEAAAMALMRTPSAYQQGGSHAVFAAGDQLRLVRPPTWNASLCPLANTGRIDAKATSNLGQEPNSSMRSCSVIASAYSAPKVKTQHFFARRLGKPKKFLHSIFGSPKIRPSVQQCITLLQARRVSCLPRPTTRMAIGMPPPAARADTRKPLHAHFHELYRQQKSVVPCIKRRRGGFESLASPFAGRLRAITETPGAGRESGQ